MSEEEDGRKSEMTSVKKKLTNAEKTIKEC